LDHLHSHDILHRDIKLDNIGVSGPEDDPIAKIIDFGFAKRANAKQSRTIVGSHGYVAPEIDHMRHVVGVLGQSKSFYKENVDVYSFGVTIFVMMVGREADSGGNMWTHEGFRAMLEDQTNRLWNCRTYQRLNIFAEVAYQELRDWGALQTIMCMTETDPKKRCRTARDAARTNMFTMNPGSVPEDWQEGEVSLGASDCPTEVELP
jgi:serine/threonine protein kinase